VTHSPIEKRTAIRLSDGRELISRLRWYGGPSTRRRVPEQHHVTDQVAGRGDLDAEGQ
jgi:hypothetical protein